MAIARMKTEGGQGGLRGHSNMNHWDQTEDIKAASRKLRRLQAKQTIRKELEEHNR